MRIYHISGNSERDRFLGMLMNIHEYQAKQILRKYGIPIPDYGVASNMDEVKQLVKSMHLDKAVLKVQIQAGGRGKAGGVKLAKNRDEIFAYAEKLIGMKIVNEQTGREGVVAHKILITSLMDYEKEYYVGVAIDRQNAKAMLIVSPEGGVEIEEVAAKTPNKIFKLPIQLDGMLRNYQQLQVVKFMGWIGETAKQGMQIITGLVRAFVETDASLLEINPLVKTADGHLFALDAKLSIDDNALYRQPTIAKFYDASQISPLESKAIEYNLAYVALDGEIGCMVNGAGLAMATMDIIQHFGGSPANFLDVGGSADKEKVAEGFKIILSDPKVKAILVNIFGGIMNCDTLASGLVAAASELHVNVPLVVRMEGTNVAQGKAIIKESGLDIITANELTDAAEKVVQLARGGGK